MRLNLKVTPKSSSNRVAGWLDNTLKVHVTAAPEQGKANAAVCALMANALGVAKGSVRVVAGLNSRRKIVEIDGLSETQVQARLDTNS